MDERATLEKALAKKRRRALSLAQRGRVREYLAEGFPLRDIARVMKVSHNAIFLLSKEFNAETPHERRLNIKAEQDANLIESEERTN